MATLLTLDASVLISAFRPNEKAYDASRKLLLRIHEREILALEPIIMPAEVAGVWARATSQAEAAREFAATLLAFPWLHLLPATATTARLAADVAATCGLRGADAFYVATARQHGATLITLDHEQQHRSPSDVLVYTPESALRHL